MRTCAFVFAHNESHFLPLWLRYYVPQVDHVVIVDHGTTDGSIPAGFEVIELDADKAFRYDYTNTQLRRIQRELLERFDVVVYSDCDEYIVPDPFRWDGLREYIDLMETEYVSCNGHDVIQVDGETPLDLSAPVLAQRSMMVHDTLYDKPLISSVPLIWVTGTHYASHFDGNRLPALRDDGLMLFHLKRADWDLYRERQLMRFPAKPDGQLRWEFEKFADSAMPIPMQFVGVL